MDNPNSTNEVDSNAILPVLKKIPIFATLDENLHKEIIKRIVLMYYPAGYQIFKEGELGDALYIIQKGKIRVYHEPKEGSLIPQEVAELNDGEFFGEIALISDIPHTAAARTMDESEVFVLSKEHFHQLMASNSEIAEKIGAIVVERLESNDKFQ
ncbi:MAG: cyclic nucleotide-binding domain-containing protein [Candidatus Gracilibacteria bacterium]|nr:cyclic nucleotide-binding domain-containing protein [Candidatus Gracilibacteria bacterium]